MGLAMRILLRHKELSNIVSSNVYTVVFLDRMQHRRARMHREILAGLEKHVSQASVLEAVVRPAFNAKWKSIANVVLVSVVAPPIKTAIPEITVTKRHRLARSLPVHRRKSIVILKNTATALLETVYLPLVFIVKCQTDADCGGKATSV